jgi:phage terminase large subunit
MAFEVTTSLKKMLRLTARKKVIQGATSSGKTYGIIPILYDRCLEKDRIKVTVVAETLSSLKEGAIDIFKNFMYDEGRWNEYAWNATSFTYTTQNGSKLQFKSFDSVGKAKAGGKRDILFLNEANHIPYEIADALMIRSREVWMDFNADSEFWAHTQVLTEKNSEFLKLTYLDNESIPDETLEDLLNRKEKAEAEERAGQKGYWWNWWQVYGLGEIGSLQGVVFNNWKTIDFVPAEAKFVGRGMDFGYTNDPTTMVDIYQFNGEYIFDEVLYKTGLTNPEIWREFKSKNLDNSIYTIADSAELKSIQELTNLGMRVKGAEKGKDSILFGIQKMQEHEFKVTQRSINLIKELRSYSWDKDREGNQLNRPQDSNNHMIDAIRYFFLSKPNSVKPKSRLI